MNVENLELTLTMRSLEVDKNGSGSINQQEIGLTVDLMPNVPATIVIGGYEIQILLKPLNTISSEKLAELPMSSDSGSSIHPKA